MNYSETSLKTTLENRNHNPSPNLWLKSMYVIIITSRLSPTWSVRWVKVSCFTVLTIYGQTGLTQVLSDANLQFYFSIFQAFLICLEKACGLAELQKWKILHCILLKQNITKNYRWMFCFTQRGYSKHNGCSVRKEYKACTITTFIILE